jgi:hypothetical protein
MDLSVTLDASLAVCAQPAPAFVKKRCFVTAVTSAGNHDG